MATQKHSQPGSRLANQLEQNVLLLVCLTPLLVPFGLTRNITLQTLVISLTGIIAWLAVYVRRQTLQLPRFLVWLLLVYVGWSILALVFHHSQADFTGTTLMHLGAIPLLAAVGCGLALRAVPARQVIQWLYIAIISLVSVSLPYAWWHHDLVRLGGLWHQPDFLAVFAAVGLLLGLELWRSSVKWRGLLICGQLLLMFSLILTQTRAVLGLVVIVGLLLSWRQLKSRRQKLYISAALFVGLAIGLVGMHALQPSRLTDTSYASQSIQYRWQLQKAALQATSHHPLFGYGPGSVPTALACANLHDTALQQTCHSGYYFDSSHNIYLDRALAFGWVSGLVLVALVGFGLYQGLRRQGPERCLAYCGLLIACYYFTNVTNLEIEVFLWVFLLRPFRTASHL